MERESTASAAPSPGGSPAHPSTPPEFRAPRQAEQGSRALPGERATGLQARHAELQVAHTALQERYDALQRRMEEYERQLQELREQSLAADDILRGTDIAVVLLDHTLRLQHFTPAVTAFFPLATQDLGRPLDQFALAFEQKDVIQVVQEVLRTGTSMARELRTRAGVWLLVRIHAVVGNTAAKTRLALTYTDITLQKQAEEAVRQFQRQLQSILDHAPAAIYIKDTDGRYLLVDRQYEASLHTTSQEIVGKTVYDLYPRHIADALAAHDRQVLEANQPLTFEEMGRGTRTFLSIKFPLRDAAGMPYALCGISTDITERKHVEEALYHAKGELEQRVQELSRLTSILEATSDIVGIADTHERILYMNAAGRRRLGLGEGPMEGLSVADFIPEWAMRVIRDEGVPAARRAGTWTGETALMSRDEREIPVSQVIIAHTSPTGRLESFSTIMRDITEELRTRDVLRQRAEEMEAFAYSASHDLQAPLRTFEGYARWLLEDYGDALGETGRQLCAEIIADALHMKTLLDGLLEYSRIGRHHVDVVRVDVQKVLNWVVHDLQLEIDKTGARLYLPATLPTVVYSEVRLTQILSNLLSNALKFIADCPPEIHLDWEEGERAYRFTVRDNGIGIAPEHFGRIFEIFRRLHTRDAYPGTGVGLTIVKKIVEAHGGQIGVESVPGQGATFWFTIPKADDPAEVR